MEIDRYMHCVLQDVPMFNTNIDINFDDKLMKLLSGRYIDFINAERFLIMNCCQLPTTLKGSGLYGNL